MRATLAIPTPSVFCSLAQTGMGWLSVGWFRSDFSFSDFGSAPSGVPHTVSGARGHAGHVGARTVRDGPKCSTPEKNHTLCEGACATSVPHGQNRRFLEYGHLPSDAPQLTTLLFSTGTPHGNVSLFLSVHVGHTEIPNQRKDAKRYTSFVAVIAPRSASATAHGAHTVTPSRNIHI